MSFGQNEWLVDEMYQQFKNDPQSLDQEWRDYFTKNSPKSESKAAAPAAQQATPKKAAANKPTETKLLDTAERKQANVTESSDITEKPKPRRKSTSPMDKADEATAPEAGDSQLKGIAKAIAKNMDLSLEIPTATSVRDMPARLMFENRSMINEHLARHRGGKISFTHILGYALVKATMIHPDMNNYYEVKDGKPTLVTPEHINLGLAIDMPSKDGSRALVVAAIRECENLTFREFLDGYEDIVSRARVGKLTGKDFAGVTISLTNPGGIGTRHSVPRLTKGQGAIIGVGSMDYPAEFAGASADRLAEVGVGKLVTVTSTYDHRIIQGAESGEFLRTMSQLLTDNVFWDEIFESMNVPYTPMRWAQDLPNTGIDKNTRVMRLIEAYRSRGHLIADINPLQFDHPNIIQPDHRDLDLATHGLTLWDLDRQFNVGGFGGKETMTLREVLSRLRNAYCLKVGTEYMHILDTDEREWLQERIEVGQPRPTHAEQKYILQKLNAAEAFENFLQTKYVGQKRFSLEGSEALIPLMDSAIDTAAAENLDEVVIGMPHRGRLNVLANIVGKPLAEIFSEFEGNMNPATAGGSGDVKYHLGTTGQHLRMFGDEEIDISLTANPSHLEAVNPVVVGMSRAKQDILDLGDEGYTIMPMVLHGDAAFSGLGVVQETLNLMGLRGYKVGGTINIVVNNQIGFTTAPDSGRSSYYCTDLAKAYGCPVFHVNGDDPEAVVWVGKLAVEYRNRFGKDVFIDLVTYRKRGHNEADDPSITQPEMYRIIDEKESVREQYTNNLIGRGDLSEEEVEAVRRDFHDQMESTFNQVRAGKDTMTPEQQTGITGSQPLPHGMDTSLSKATMAELGATYANVPEGFTLHKRLRPMAKKRADSTTKGDVDWATAELLALGSVAGEGSIVRFAGEDVRRGTFTQRHAVLVDPETGNEYSPLDTYAKNQGNGGKFMIYNSALTEFAGMGYEYGYTLGNPDATVVWEAQFGDFANGAQTIIDQYVSSGEAKWGQTSKLILLLPHGYEGQGPDHSSARIERFLQLCAEGSFTAAQPTDPANYFHLLRRHINSDLHRPLVIFSPKSMLRNKAAVSPVEDFTEKTKFESVLDDPTFSKQDGDRSKVKTVLMCSGKIYYDLAAKKEKDGRDDVAIVRVEMLHPVPFNRIRETLESYPNYENLRWVQDEPANQGPWPFLALQLPELLPDLPRITRISRRAQSSTATGVAKVHAIEEKALLEEAFQK